MLVSHRKVLVNILFLMIRRPQRSTRTDTLFPYTTLFRSIKTTASRVKMRGKPAFVIFTAGSPTAPRMYDEVAQLVQDYGLDACPHHIADSPAFRHAGAGGKTARATQPSAQDRPAGRRRGAEWCRTSRARGSRDLDKQKTNNQTA